MSDPVLDTIRRYLRKNGSVSEKTIAEDFLKIPGSPAASQIIRRILSRDTSFYCSEGMWKQDQSAAGPPKTLGGEKFFTAYMPTTPADTEQEMFVYEICHGEIRSIGNYDSAPTESSSFSDALWFVLDAIENHTVFFFSPEQEERFRDLLQREGLPLPSGTAQISFLFTLTGLIPPPLRETPRQLAAPFIQPPDSKKDPGHTLAALLHFCIRRLEKEGCETMEEFEEELWKKVYSSEKAPHTAPFRQSIPAEKNTPGIICLRDADTHILHIESTARIQRSMQYYLRPLSALPRSSAEIIGRCTDYTAYYYETEIEARIIAIRLRCKHLPREMNDTIQQPRDGLYTKKCIVILSQPSDNTEVKTLWYNPAAAKCIVKTISSSDTAKAYTPHIHSYFFLSHSEQDTTEEQLAAGRYIQYHDTRHRILPAENYSGAEEMTRSLLEFIFNHPE
ncbi:MAG: hypothetical protein ACQEQ4_03390 [Fibrobacterota bacterium]